MVFGAGLMAGLLGEIGHAINSQQLQHISRIAWWVLPFDALYEDALHRLTIDTTGFAEVRARARAVRRLAPAGRRCSSGRPLILVLVLGAAVAAFSLRDL